jgi:hypothetical protein
MGRPRYGRHDGPRGGPPDLARRPAGSGLGQSRRHRSGLERRGRPLGGQDHGRPGPQGRRRTDARVFPEEGPAYRRRDAPPHRQQTPGLDRFDVYGSTLPGRGRRGRRGSQAGRGDEAPSLGPQGPALLPHLGRRQEGLRAQGLLGRRERLGRGRHGPRRSSPASGSGSLGISARSSTVASSDGVPTASSTMSSTTRRRSSRRTWDSSSLI